MLRSETANHPSQSPAWKNCLRSGILFAFCVAGCGDTPTAAPPATSQQAPQTYFAPVISGMVGISTPQTFVFDDEKATFSQETFALRLPAQTGLQVLNAGTFTASQRGLESLGILTTYTASDGADTYTPQNYQSPGLPGSFAVELAGQAGGLVQLVGQPVEPFVAATQCPNFITAQAYQFITIPASEDLSLQPVPPGSPADGPTLEQTVGSWNPMTDTAYGSADIIVNGTAVTFQNIHQFTLTSKSPVQPSSSSVIGGCGSTTLGSITGIPGQYVVTEPGVGNNSAAPQAAVGIGPTGLLVEDSGNSPTSGLEAGTSPGIHYQNALGAGTGAVGLPKPSSPLNTSTVAGAQYLGFVYQAGTVSPFIAPTSHLASFGFANVPTSCGSITPVTSTLIYGGDFAQANGQDSPSDSPDGYGKCDFAIDLGAQDSVNNGLYPHTTIWVGATYTGNTTGGTYSFPAVAIAGQLKNKYGLFVIGLDSTQPWAIYLLQSN